MGQVSDRGRMSGGAGGVRSAARCRGRMLQSTAAIVALLAALLVCSPPAHALSQRGHVFASSFGEALDEGGAGKLSKPSAVAVDEASGDVYVLDSANNRVVRFGPAPEHKFLEAWGYGVKDGKKEIETCTSKCQPGIAGFGKGQLDSPVAIAVDNCTITSARESKPCTTEQDPSVGDVYVAANSTWKKAVVDKFSSEGKLVVSLIAKKEEKELEGMVDGVAVDSSGTVWVEREDEESEFMLERFNDEAKNTLLEASALEVENLEGARPTRPGFAVDSKGDVYTTYEPNGIDLPQREEEAEEIKERERERKENKEELKHETPQEPCQRNPCLVAKLGLGHGGELGVLEAQPLIYEVDSENTTGVAVDLSSGTPSSDDVYLDNATSVAAFTSGGTLIQRFGSEQLHGGGGSGLAVDAKTGEVLVADVAAGRIDVYELAHPGPPVVKAGSVLAAHTTSSSAELRATIDPTGAETSYRFQYGTANASSFPTPPGSCAESPSSCTEAAPAPSENELGQGFGDQSASVKVAGLPPSTTYHFRVIAENKFAKGSESVLSEEEGTFTTQPSAIASALPDGRAWELVSPANKHGASIEPIGMEGGLIQAASDGTSLTYIADAPVGENEPEGNRAPEPAQIIASRTKTGWSSQDIATPNGEGLGDDVGNPREYRFFSSDLALGLVYPDSYVPLSLETSERTIYLRDDAPLGPQASEAANYEAAKHSGELKGTAGYLPLLTAANDTGEELIEKVLQPSRFANTLEFDTATPDLSHVVLKANVPLTSGASGAGLYEWSGGRLQLVSVLPNGKQPTGSFALGAGKPTEMLATAISADGARVVWSTAGHEVKGNETGHLYMREAEKGETLQVDEPDSNAPKAMGEPDPVFQTASADGSRVFFTDSQQLTEDSTATVEPLNKAPQDLYVFEAQKPKGERVTDLTPVINSSEGAGVQGGVLGASEDGSSVYFVANGVLAAGAQSGGCRFHAPTGVGCNLYVAHYNGEQWEEQPRFIARLSSEDAPDWGRPEGSYREYDLKDLTARVSPNGEYLAFMSDQSKSLTGYNNTDENSGVADEEVFLYNLRSGRHVCASCDPSGAQPVGVYDTEGSSEGLQLLVDGPAVWGTAYAGVDHWLAGNIPGWTAIGLNASLYQSRYLSNEGRLFFNSADSLVPRDIDRGKENVYEYEPAGVGGTDGCRGKAEGTAGSQEENTEGGCVALISSGESSRESAFLDASENGNDVFLLTSSQLSPQDHDTAFDVYDARVCKAPGAEACASSGSTPPPQCKGEACKSAPETAPTYGAPASTTFSGSGNMAPQAEVLGSQSVKAKTPTRAEELAKALKACKSDKSKSKRLACEKQARTKYGPTRAEELAKALKACKSDKSKSKRLACEKQARGKYGAKASKAKRG